MVKETAEKDKESKKEKSSKSSDQTDETSKTDDKSEGDETSETNPNEEQSEVESGDATEKSDEEHLSEKQSGSKKNSESSIVDDDSKPEDGTINDDDSETPSIQDESDSENSENVEELSDEKTEPNNESENTEESEPADAETSEAADNQEGADTEETPPGEKESPENKMYTFDEMVDISGYGRFQRILTFLVGLGWMADAFEIRVLSMLGDFIACEWTLYRWHSAALTSIVFIGMLFGAPVFGIIADNYGRRKSLAISLLLLFIFGATSAASGSIAILLVMRFITGFVFGGAQQGFTLCAEYYPTKDRGIAGFYLRYYWAIGTVLVILLTWCVMELTEHWYYLVIGASIPSLIVFFTIYWFPESIRWYLVSGKYEKAMEQLSKLLTMNKSDLKASQLKKIPEEEMEQKGNFLHLVRSPHTKTTLLLWYIAFATSFHYYGITLLAPYVIYDGKLMVPENEKDRMPVVNLTSPSEYFLSVKSCRHPSQSNYIDLMWHSSAEFPGLIFFTLVVRYMERRTLLSVSCMINSFIVLLLLAEAKSSIPSKIVLFIARANCIGFLQLVVIISAESFPTTLRATGVGSVAAFAKLGGAMVPFVAQVLIIEDPIATVCILGAVILLGAAAGSYLPRDMKGVPLKELTEDQIKADMKKEEEDKEV